MVSIETCHPGDPSSIPWQTKLFFLKKIAKVPEPFRELRHSCEFLSGKFCKFKSWPHVKIAKVCILYPFAEKLREFNAQVFFINEFVTIFTHFHRIYWFSWSKFDLTEKSSCLTVHIVEKWKIWCHWKSISSNQLFSDLFSKTVAFTKFLPKKCETKIP